LRTFARIWRHLGWRHVWVALAGGVLISMSVAFSTLHLSLFRKHTEFLGNIQWYVPIAAVFVLGVVIVEATAPRRRPRLRGYLIAALLAAAVSLAGTYVAGPSLKMGRRDVPGFPNPTKSYSQQPFARTSAIFGIGFEGVMHCAIALFVYVRLRESRFTAQALGRRQARASEAARIAADARLESVRHRIDPGFLTGALEDIERTYWTDPARAEARLDELIEFLRAAIPTARAAGRPGTPHDGREAAD
jgi:hypothetical protein